MNEKNLIPNEERTPNERRENAKKAGIASGKARREKKTIQKILDDYLNKSVKDVKNLEKIAKSTGIETDKSIKELVTAVCLLNTLKKGDVYKLQKLCELLGENNETEHLEDISEAEAEVFGD